MTKEDKENDGRIEVRGTETVDSMEDMSRVYTPGVAEPSREISDDEIKAYDLTSKGDMVGVVSDGSAVLGLGDVGPHASIPVMEGKSLLISEFAGASSFPVVMDTETPEEIVETVSRLHPMFGFILLEDISSPECFQVEEDLKDELEIPVFHDDQHGAAIVTLAGLENALDVVGKEMEEVSIVLVGAGAAGTATAELLLEAGAEDVAVVDRPGILSPDMDLPDHQQRLAERTNPGGEKKGDLADAVEGADVFIGLAVGGILSKENVRSMAEDPIVFALANPEPEIPYSEARDAGAAVVATGRSDFPNQVNNALAFPGIIKGALRCRAFEVNDEMQVAAADAIASLVEPEPERILPNALEEGLHEEVAEAVLSRGEETGACRLGKGDVFG